MKRKHEEEPEGGQGGGSAEKNVNEGICGFYAKSSFCFICDLNRDQMVILALRFIAEQPTIQELLENGNYSF